MASVAGYVMSNSILTSCLTTLINRRSLALSLVARLLRDGILEKAGVLLCLFNETFQVVLQLGESLVCRVVILSWPLSHHDDVASEVGAAWPKGSGLMQSR